ncbi:MAG: hypothetical protein ABIF09_17110 [Gemmatimonadota bacterium]
MVEGRTRSVQAPVRTATVLILAILVLARGWGGAAAQTPSGTETALYLLQSPATAVDTAFTDAPSWGGRIVSGLAAAALGAGIGFFASQIAQGDWDKDGAQKQIHRSAWAAVGGASGFALGFSLPVWGQPPGGGTSILYGGDRFLITGDEIREASVSNALEAVRLFHPEWLVQRGQEAFAEPESDNLRVYLDNVQLGGIEDLAGVNTLIIEELRFFDGQRATARWGTGHSHGAIEVVTMS